MPYELLDLQEEQPQGETNIDKAGRALGKAGRTLARSGVRAAESILGAPGNILGAGVNAVNYISGGRTPSVEQLNQQPSKLNIPLPTSEQIKQSVTKPLTGEYLEPQSEAEQGWDDIVSDAATIFLPMTGGPVAKGLKALGIAGAGNLAKWSAESLTGSPLAGAGAKLGTMVLAGTLGTRKELNNLRQKSYQDAYATLPANKRFNFSPEAASLDKTLKKVMRSSIPDKKEVLDRLQEFQNIANKNGAAKVQEVIGIKQGWNEYLREKGKSLAPSAKREIEEAVSTLNSGINRYGKTDKKFWAPYIQGEELTSGLRGMDSVSDFISKRPSLQKKMDNPILGSLFKYGSGYGAGQLLSQYPVQIGGALGVLFGIQQTARTLKLLSKSPIARSAYKDAIESALKGNVANFSRDLDKIEKEYFKQLPSLGRYELLDLE